MVFFTIPSYKRSSYIASKTLKLLLTFQVPQQNIYVFVVAEDKEDYQKELSLYPDIHIIVGPVGLHHMRNFIRDYFPEDTELVQMDDDIEDLYQMKEDTSIDNINSCKRYPLYPISKEEFHFFIQDAFQELRNHGIYLFGIYPVKNGFFMKDLPYKTYDLRFCVGVMWGCINQHAKNLYLDLEEKEDVERTLRYYVRDHKILRYNRIVPKTKYYKNNGGMQSRSNNRLQDAHQSCIYLLEHFPKYCKLYTSKKSGIPEIKFITHPIV